MVEYGSPKPGVVGSSPTAPAKMRVEKMINPLKFIQSVKQEAFKVTWPTRKDVLLGSFMVFASSSYCCNFFLFLDQLYKFLLDLILTINIVK